MTAENKYINGAKHRLRAVRLRTWIVTFTILISLAFWILLSVTTRDTISWIDFIMLVVVQTLGHFAYFPDGEAFGQTDDRFIANKRIYNELASKINTDDKYYRLREYCTYEYEERKEQYINTMLGYIGITEKEFEQIKLMPEKEIKKLKEFEIVEKVKGEDVSRLVHFSKVKRKILHDLIFKPLPVKRNEADTIVSGKEIDTTQNIKDHSEPEKKKTHGAKVIKIIVIGILLAYITWNIKDGFNWLTDTARLITYVGSLLITAIMSFTSGEKIQKIDKTEFYVELSQFIEKFYEWDKKHE